jgi:hypothetical protein
MRPAAVVLLLAAALSGCGGAPRAEAPASPGAGCAHRATCAVLFAGNSLTFVNDLPHTFERLAASGGRDVVAVQAASGGETLAQHVSTLDVAVPLRERVFNVVVLQEQTAHAALPDLRAESTLPAARTLVAAARAEPAQPILFSSWAWTYGVASRGIDGAAMQQGIADGYRELAEELGVRLAPVGAAWMTATAEAASGPLWQEDGNHPTVAGTYLAACVFYATIFGADPRGLAFHDGLDAATAARLQAVAARTALGRA